MIAKTKFTVCIVLCHIGLTNAISVRGGIVPPDKKTAAKIQKLIADLDSASFKVRARATRELIRLGDAALPALRTALKNPPTLEVRQRVQQILGKGETRFAANSPGWMWIYQGIAHGQTFKAKGRQITVLRLRVARLNPNLPKADLEVEIRDNSLKRIYARGFISRKKADRLFAWRQVDLKLRRPLVPGKTYLLFFHSQDSTHTGPWVVNQVYQDVYPDGEYPRGDADFFFHIQYKNGKRIHVGPDLDTPDSVPINSGLAGGGPYPGPLTIQNVGRVPHLIGE